MLPKYRGIDLNPELIKLEEMFQMQRKLNNRVFREKGITVFPRSNLQLALLDEIGELNHELKPHWCYWKVNQKPMDYKKALEEYVDCLHFVLSLCSEDGDMKWGRDQIYSHCIIDTKVKTYTIYFKILHYTGVNNPRRALVWFFRLGNRLGFSLDEVHKMYMEKNAINHTRLSEGY